MNNLQERLSDVFGVLERHNPHATVQPCWAISDQAVRVPGRDSDGSESEDDAGDLNECVEVLRMVEDEEGEATMARKMPSSSACKAFNQEDEEDEFDRLACESLQRLRCRPKPALKTQVAERNIYDRMTCSSQSPVSPTCPANTPTLAQLTAHAQTNFHGSARKKVRFRESDDFCDAPAAALAGDSDCPMDREAGPSPQLRQKLTSGDAAAAAPRETDAQLVGSPRALVPVVDQTMSGTQKSLSYVPEHVRRPEAFTCYELDTPVVVGSGFDGSVDPLTAGPASEQTTLGASPGRVFSGIHRTAPHSSALQGCLKPSGATIVEASNLRFAGIPEAEYLQSSAVAAQQGASLSMGGSDLNGAGDAAFAEPPEMVAFVPGKSSKPRTRSGLGGAAVELLDITGQLEGQGDEAMNVSDGAALGPSSVGVNSQCAQRSRGVLSVPGGDEDDVMDVDEGEEGAMQLLSGTVRSALGGGLSEVGAGGGVEAEPISMRDGGMTFEFPMDASQQTVGGVGVLGGGVAFVSTSVNRGQKNRRGRRQADE